MSSSAKSYYYVGVFHTKDARLQYDNFAYTFAAEPPFRILEEKRKKISCSACT